MGFCTPEQHQHFLRECPTFERQLIEDGIILIKYWLEVGPEEQRARFQERIDDPIKRWKLGPIDLEAQARYYDYSRARDTMFANTDTPESPWYVVPSDNQRRGRLNCIAHLLELIPYERIAPNDIELPELQEPGDYRQPPEGTRRVVPSRY